MSASAAIGVYTVPGWGAAALRPYMSSAWIVDFDWVGFKSRVWKTIAAKGRGLRDFIGFFVFVAIFYLLTDCGM
jgi:hypothetical protein